MNPLKHAQSSVKKFGGKMEDYIAIHLWFDHSKQYFADPRHRALRHHAEGIFMAEHVFGHILHNSDDKPFSVRAVGEQHVVEDLGFVPTLQDWLKHIQIQPWMLRNGRRAKIGRFAERVAEVADYLETRREADERPDAPAP